jgi:hypothetical protein
MSVPVEVFRTVDVYQKSTDIIYFWPFRDATHFWSYAVVPSLADQHLGYQSVEVTKTSLSNVDDRTLKVNLWVSVRRPGLIFFTAMRAPF